MVLTEKTLLKMINQLEKSLCGTVKEMMGILKKAVLNPEKYLADNGPVIRIENGEAHQGGKKSRI